MPEDVESDSAGEVAVPDVVHQALAVVGVNNMEDSMRASASPMLSLSMKLHNIYSMFHITSNFIAKSFHAAPHTSR